MLSPAGGPHACRTAPLKSCAPEVSGEMSDLQGAPGALAEQAGTSVLPARTGSARLGSARSARPPAPLPTPPHLCVWKAQAQGQGPHQGLGQPTSIHPGGITEWTPYQRHDVKMLAGSWASPGPMLTGRSQLAAPLLPEAKTQGSFPSEQTLSWETFGELKSEQEGAAFPRQAPWQGLSFQAQR